MAETMMDLHKTEFYRNPAMLVENSGPWKGLDDLEIATARWVAWFNDEQLHSELDDRTPVEVEAEHYAHQSQPDAAGETQPPESLQNLDRFGTPGGYVQGG